MITIITKTITLNLQASFTIGVLTIGLLNFIETSKPHRKRQQAAWRIECELGMISDPDCPVDGGWTAWEPWSACHGSCDDEGHRRRTRQCINPPPSDDGLPCSGPDQEIQPCYITNCTVDDYKKLIEGDATRMEAYRQLEAVPSLMERCLQVECRYGAIEAALASDNTWQLDPEVIWNSLQCVKHNLGCPVLGEWGSWGAWSACGARCGRGLRWRLRRCDAPLPSNENLFCTGTPLHAEECQGDQCALDLIDVEDQNSKNQWSPWEEWTPCTEKCGAGIRRRRRTCLEKFVHRSIGTWGTHCVGQHDEIEVCETQTCVLDGGWSGWGAWGPCSQTCGAGKRFRTRSCTRPVPSRGGKNCTGPKTEYVACYLNPCDAFTHNIVLFNGDSLLQYNFERKRSTLFHFYVRFISRSPHGTLIRRGTIHSPHVRLSMQKWHLCLDARGSSTACVIPRICSPAIIDPGLWQSALITVTNEAATLRLNDAVDSIKASFSCDPELPDDKMNILIGERFHGEIQEVLLNFIPLDMIINRDQRAVLRSDFVPSAASNIALEKASLEEAYLSLHTEQYLRVPCFDDQDEWRLELTIKSKSESGTILFLRDDKSASWLHMGLQNMRLKLKIALGSFRSESSSSTECLPDQWLDVMLVKKRESNAIEASINAGEKVHVVLEDLTRKRRVANKKSCSHSSYNVTILNAISSREATKNTHAPLAICNDEFFVGGIPAESKMSVEQFTPFSGIIASISINNILQDLHKFNIERFKDNKVQVSSRTASISGSYHETVWGSSNRLNLTCLHARTARSPNTAHWLYFDTTVSNVVKEKSVRSVDDGRVLRLVASAVNDLRGFYTCRVHANKKTRNIVTYGVVGKVQYNLSGPDSTTALAVITTFLIVLMTLGWLIYEGYHDLRTGYGFFRDCHITPEEEAEAVCRYIDDNMHLIGSKTAAKIAKARARRRGRQLALASRLSFAAQEPQGMMQFEHQMNDIEESYSEHDDPVADAMTSEPEELPALPESKSNQMEDHKVNLLGSVYSINQIETVEMKPMKHMAGTVHSVYRCEPSYISSPRHGSLTSPRTKLSSSSSFEATSPRYLCNRLFLPRKIHSSRESIWSKKNRNRNLSFDATRKTKPNLLTIKSSTLVGLSPGKKILQKFQDLKCDDYD